MRFFKCWFDSLTPEQRRAIKNYTDGEYREINQCVRGKGPCSEKIKKMIEDIREALDKAEMPMDLIVKRGGIVDILGKINKEVDAMKNPQELIGKEIHTRGFMSTGFVDPRMDNVVINITIRKGTKGCAYVGNVSANKNEEEVLCLPGKILLIKKVELRDKRLIVEAVMVN
jgi:hypothetical protein